MSNQRFQVLFKDRAMVLIEKRKSTFHQQLSGPVISE